MRESEIIMDFAEQVRRALEAQGFQVIQTRRRSLLRRPLCARQCAARSVICNPAHRLDRFARNSTDERFTCPFWGPAELEGLLIVTEHFRSGLLLTPITAQLVCEWVTKQSVSLDWECFTPKRFAETDRAASTSDEGH